MNWICGCTFKSILMKLENSAVCVWEGVLGGVWEGVLGGVWELSLVNESRL